MDLLLTGIVFFYLFIAKPLALLLLAAFIVRIAVKS